MDIAPIVAACVVVFGERDGLARFADEVFRNEATRFVARPSVFVVERVVVRFCNGFPLVFCDDRREDGEARLFAGFAGAARPAFPARFELAFFAALFVVIHRRSIAL